MLTEKYQQYLTRRLLLFSGLVGRSGSPGKEQAKRSGRPQRTSGRREEAETDLDSGTGKKKPGSLLRRATQAVGGENRGHRGKAGPEEERGAGLVLQPAPEAEEDEVCGATLTRWKLSGVSGQLEENYSELPKCRHTLR